MFVAVTYALTALTVGLLLLIAGRQHHTKLGNSEVFRYPPVFRYLFAGVFLLFLAVGFYNADESAARGLASWEMVFSWVVFGGSCALSLFGFIWTLRYTIVVSESTIVIKGLVNIRSFATNEVCSTEVHSGFRGARDLVVRDSRGRVLLKVGGTIQDFDELVRLIRSKIPKNGDRGVHPR